MWGGVGLQVDEALKAPEVQQAPLREVGRMEELAELLLLGMKGEEGRAALENVVM